MAKIDWKASNIFKLLKQQVKEYNSVYNLKDICIAGQTAPAGVLNDVYYYIGDVTATIFGIQGIVANSFLRYNGTAWESISGIENFAKISKGKNLFDKLKATDGYYINWITGDLGESEVYSTSDFIPVKPTTNYFLSGNGANKYMVWYTSEMVYISGNINTAPPYLSPANAAYVRITCHIVNKDTTQFEQGIVATEYVAYEQQLVNNVKDFSIEYSKLSANLLNKLFLKSILIKSVECDFFEPAIGRNLFDKSKATDGYFVNWITGDLGEQALYSASDFIPVDPSTAYYLSGHGWNYYTAWYTSAKVFISGNQDQLPPLVSPSNAAFVRTTCKLVDKNTTQFEKGSVATSFEAYQQFYKLKDIKTLAEDIVGLADIVNAAITPSLAVLGFSKVNRISLPAKQYFLGNYENTIYHDAICERCLPDNYFLRLENSAFSNLSKSARLTNPVAASGINANLYDLNFEIMATKQMSVIVGQQATDNGACVIHALGDSFTHAAKYLFRAKELCPNLTFSAMRQDGWGYGVTMEGRSGWSLNMYFNTKYYPDGSDSFSPYLQPIDPYKYYGDTLFWKNVVNNVGLTQGQGGFLAKATEIGFSAATGLKIAPSTNDVMWNNSNARYEVWNGTAWVLILESVLNFAFNFGKYRTVWNIIQPNIFTSLLGTNDFYSVSPGDLPAVFATWKIQFETLIASVHADSPNCKIALLTPASVWGGANDSIDSDQFNQKHNAYMWNARKLLIDNFDEREAEKIYLVDTGSAIDSIFGFDLGASEKPYSDFTGLETIKLQANSPHPSMGGYAQMGVRLAGFIQAVR